MRALLFMSLFFLASSCSSQSSSNNSPHNPREYQIGAYLWQQHSGEYRALTYQAYNTARLKIERDLLDKHNKKRAVIFDIDETVLDNSYGGAREIKASKAWSESLFADWVKLKEAVAIPGALDFINYLTKERVAVFYVTNRTTEMYQDTFDNLVKEGFPVNKDNLIMMNKEKSKESRRLDILKNYEVVLLVGDNLGDFHKAFDTKSKDERNGAVDQMKELFGHRFIVLPNPLYGDWERVFPYDKSKIEILKLTP